MHVTLPRTVALPTSDAIDTVAHLRVAARQSTMSSMLSAASRQGEGRAATRAHCHGDSVEIALPDSCDSSV